MITTTANKIEARELRIGNWVLHRNSFKQIIEVYEVAVRINIGPINVSYGIEKLEPIPLTPEILEKAGFKSYSDETFSIKAEGGLFGVDTVDGDEWRILIDGYVRGFKPLKYLHQLQNLYFALTGEELKIEL